MSAAVIFVWSESLNSDTLRGKASQAYAHQVAEIIMTTLEDVYLQAYGQINEIGNYFRIVLCHNESVCRVCSVEKYLNRSSVQGGYCIRKDVQKKFGSSQQHVREWQKE